MRKCSILADYIVKIGLYSTFSALSGAIFTLHLKEIGTLTFHTHWEFVARFISKFLKHCFAKIWHFLALMALKDTKKPIKNQKRLTMAVKVIPKARELENGKILILLHFCVHLVSKMKRIQDFDGSRS